ncbi:hypothetical protein EDEG_01568, partial [Edhazardia aedis USNM 41457]
MKVIFLIITCFLLFYILSPCYINSVLFLGRRKPRDLLIETEITTEFEKKNHFEENIYEFFGEARKKINVDIFSDYEKDLKESENQNLENFCKNEEEDIFCKIQKNIQTIRIENKENPASFYNTSLYLKYQRETEKNISSKAGLKNNTELSKSSRRNICQDDIDISKMFKPNKIGDNIYLCGAYQIYSKYSYSPADIIKWALNSGTIRKRLTNAIKAHRFNYIHFQNYGSDYNFKNNNLKEFTFLLNTLKSHYSKLKFLNEIFIMKNHKFCYQKKNFVDTILEKTHELWKTFDKKILKSEKFDIEDFINISPQSYTFYISNFDCKLIISLYGNKLSDHLNFIYIIKPFFKTLNIILDDLVENTNLKNTITLEAIQNTIEYQIYELFRNFCNSGFTQKFEVKALNPFHFETTLSTKYLVSDSTNKTSASTTINLAPALENAISGEFLLCGCFFNGEPLGCK